MTGPTNPSRNATIRFQFERTGRLRFTSHLDMLRTFQRAFSRSKIPIAYSQGFNPHPEFVIGVPLGVGTTSEAEYAEVGMEILIPITDFIDMLNSKLPDGLKVIAAEYQANKDNIMATINELRCLITFEKKVDELLLFESLKRLLEKDSILIEKFSNKGQKIVEIRSKIREVKICEDGKIALRCDAGSHSNLSPELFVKALKKEMSEMSKISKTPNSMEKLEVPTMYYFTVHRTGISIEKNGKIIDPMSFEALN